MRALRIALWTAGSLAALYLVVTLVIFFLAFRRFREDHDPMKGLTHATDKLLAPYAVRIDAGKSWLREHASVPVEITSAD